MKGFYDFKADNNTAILVDGRTVKVKTALRPFKVEYITFCDAYFHRSKTKYFDSFDEFKEWYKEANNKITYSDGSYMYWFKYATLYAKTGRSYEVVKAELID